MLVTSLLPSNISLFPGIADRVYFQNPETKEFWFHATDVCKTLGYTNVTSAISLHCDDDEKLQEIWNGKATWFVSEAGCYGLAMGAKNDIAKKFKRWLKHDVLPKLRSSAGYIMPNASSEQLKALKSEIISMENEINRVTQLNKEVSEIDAKLAFIIREIVDKILGQARNLRPSANSKKEEEYSEYWKTLYKLQPVLHKLFPMELTTKQCFDDTLTENTIHELFNVICLKVSDVTWENNFENCRTFNMSEN